MSENEISTGVVEIEERLELTIGVDVEIIGDYSCPHTFKKVVKRVVFVPFDGGYGHSSFCLDCLLEKVVSNE